MASSVKAAWTGSASGNMLILLIAIPLHLIVMLPGWTKLKCAFMLSWDHSRFSSFKEQLRNAWIAWQLSNAAFISLIEMLFFYWSQCFLNFLWYMTVTILAESESITNYCTGQRTMYAPLWLNLHHLASYFLYIWFNQVTEADSMAVHKMLCTKCDSMKFCFQLNYRKQMSEDHLFICFYFHFLYYFIILPSSCRGFKRYYIISL